MKKNLLLALALAAACADAAPAYYRQQIGDLRVTALFDGTLHLPRGDIKNIPAEDVAKLLDNFSQRSRLRAFKRTANVCEIQSSFAEAIVYQLRTLSSFHRSKGSLACKNFIYNNGKRT